MQLALNGSAVQPAAAMMIGIGVSLLIGWGAIVAGKKLAVRSAFNSRNIPRVYLGDAGG